MKDVATVMRELELAQATRDIAVAVAVVTSRTDEVSETLRPLLTEALAHMEQAKCA